MTTLVKLMSERINILFRRSLVKIHNLKAVMLGLDPGIQGFLVFSAKFTSLRRRHWRQGNDKDESSLAMFLVFCISIVLWTVFFLSLPAPHAEAFKIRVLPSKIYPGDAFMVKVSGLKKAAEPSALFNDKPLYFSSCGKGCFMGLGVTDLNTKPGDYRVHLKVGKRKTTYRMRVLKDKFETINLTLPEEKVSPSPEDIERINKEADLLSSIWQIDSERLWEGDFLLPLQNSLSTPFGTKRIINVETVSIHKGLDMKGEEGEEIKASNTGRVVLAEELFFGGNTIILDHGQGIFTIYMHMSGFKVSPGDLVSKNETIGFVGSTGRSTGPHLHFGVKVAGINANPVSLTDLNL